MSSSDNLMRTASIYLLRSFQISNFEMREFLVKIENFLRILYTLIISAEKLLCIGCHKRSYALFPTWNFKEQSF